MSWVSYVVRLLTGRCPKCGGTLKKLDFQDHGGCVFLMCQTLGCTYWRRA